MTSTGDEPAKGASRPRAGNPYRTRAPNGCRGPQGSTPLMWSLATGLKL